MEIAGGDAALVLHHNSCGKALSAGGGAGIKHLISWFWRGGKHRHARGSVLNIKQSIVEFRERGNIACSLKLKAVRKIIVLLYRDAIFGKPL